MDTLSPTRPAYGAMSYEELTAHKKELDAAYENKKADAHIAFLERFKQEAAVLGLDLGALGVQMPVKARGKAAGARTTAPVLYRHPETREGWSGRGKPKKWALAIIAKEITADKGSAEYDVQFAAALAKFKDAYKVA